MNVNSILKQLDRFGICEIDHSHEGLRAHLKETSMILQRWGCAEPICLAGLCHSIYGTESFLKTAATLDNRTYMKNLIGAEAENLTYLFGAHKKETLWENLEKSNDFQIVDRFLNHSVKISRSELEGLITITLANWLEQRPRAGQENQYIRSNEFRTAKEFLPKLAYQEFLNAYQLK